MVFGAITDALGKIDSGTLINAALGAVSNLGSGNREVSDAQVRQIDASIKQAEEQLLFERDRLAQEQRQAGFNAALDNRRIEIELALAAIQQAKESMPSRELELQARQQGIQQRGEDSSRVIDALDRVAGRFQGGLR